jgi:hypothetical protein
MMAIYHGSCLCGTIKYEVTGPIETFRYCFCPRCQKVSGGAQVANCLVNHSQLKWVQGETNATRYDLPEAKRFAHGFCKTCGSPVPYELRDKTGIVVPAGSLDDNPGIKPQGIIYWDHRPEWYVEPNGLEKM